MTAFQAAGRSGSARCRVGRLPLQDRELDPRGCAGPLRDHRGYRNRQPENTAAEWVVRTPGYPPEPAHPVPAERGGVTNGRHREANRAGVLAQAGIGNVCSRLWNHRPSATGSSPRWAIRGAAPARMDAPASPLSSAPGFKFEPKCAATRGSETFGSATGTHNRSLGLPSRELTLALPVAAFPLLAVSLALALSCPWTFPCLCRHRLVRSGPPEQLSRPSARRSPLRCPARPARCSLSWRTASRMGRGRRRMLRAVTQDHAGSYQRDDHQCGCNHPRDDPRRVVRCRFGGRVHRLGW